MDQVYPPPFCAPLSAEAVEGPGWRLVLNPGWGLEAGELGAAWIQSMATEVWVKSDLS
ncbi:hypothetical protein D3C87_1856900 [compost metagenome]